MSASAQDSATNDYSLVIYLNGDFVSGLIQQLFNIGLPVDEMRETLGESLEKRAREASGSGEVEAGLQLPWAGKFGLRGSMAGRTTSAEDAREEVKNQLKFQYTQANFLHNVRQQLRERELVRGLADVQSVEALNVGDFVEFSAVFEANELNSIVDLATPELVSAIVRWRAKQDQRDKFDYYYERGQEELQKFIQKSNLEAESRAEIAAAAMRAVQQDFRNETTREYFGNVIGGEARRPVTAVTICDTEHFLSRDKDRLLDGTFTVLGKVSHISFSGVSVLARNKILNRIKQPMLDEFNKVMKSAGQDGRFNSRFRLNLRPPVVKVVPIAIYV